MAKKLQFRNLFNYITPIHPLKNVGHFLSLKNTLQIDLGCCLNTKVNYSLFVYNTTWLHSGDGILQAVLNYFINDN